MKNWSVVSLIAANSVPFFGILFSHWSLFSVIFFYWIETIVVAIYAFLKMAKAEKIEQESGRALYKKSDYILSSFAKYSFALGLYGVFIFAIYGHSDITVSNLIIGLTSLFISHGVSYFENFIGKKEYQKVSPAMLSFQPVSRMCVMQLTIVSTGFIYQIINSPAFLVLILIIAKTFMDLYFHNREHEKFLEEKEISKIDTLESEKIITQNYGDLRSLNTLEPTKKPAKEELREMRKKVTSVQANLMAKLATKDMFDIAMNDPIIAKIKLKQKMDSLMNEGSKENSESEQKNNNEIP